MRKWFGLAWLLAASCTPQPAVPPKTAQLPDKIPAADVIYLDQGWSAADRAVYTGTPQGSHLMPAAWFMALRRSDADAPFAGDQLQRFGYLAADDATSLPIGFVRDGTRQEPQIGMTCAACHTGQLQAGGVTWRIEGGRAHADFQAFLTELGAASAATLFDQARFAAFATTVLGASATPAQVAGLRVQMAAWLGRYQPFMAASLPDPAWGPGRLDAFGMIFNRVTGLDLNYPANLAKADAPVRYPFIWDAPRQDHTQWTGAAPNGTYLRGLARNTGEVFGVFGQFNPTPLPFHAVIYDNSVNLTGLQALEEKIVALRAPPWPAAAFPLDAAKVSRGQALFAAQCAGCHGVNPSAIVRNAWNTPVRAVGTDPRAFDNSQGKASPRVLTGMRQGVVFGERLTDPSAKLDILANAVIGSLVKAALVWDPAIREAIGADLAQSRLPVVGPGPATTPAGAVADVTNATQALYKTPVQVPGAAYEARVLTGIWAVGPYLHNGSVPTLYELLKPPHDRMTRFAVGHEQFDPVRVGLQTDAAPGRAMFVVDPTVGNSNDGHDYGTSLPDTDRWALVEYMKTL